VRRITLTAVVFSLLFSSVAFADAYGDLMKAQAAFRSLKSWHAEEHLSDGKTVVVDFATPDRWRLQPAPNITELVIGGDVYMVRDGRPMKLPFGGMMISHMIKHFQFSADADVKKTAQDLGMKTVNGRSLHAYSCTVRGVPETLYLRADSLPVEAVVKDRGMTTVIDYSRFNEPISIEAPAS
jgi:uncharacterized protein (DUF111 family)